MKRFIIFLVISLFLIIGSALPLYEIAREKIIDNKLSSRYLLEHAYVEEPGFPRIIDVNEMIINGMKLEIVEEQTGKKAPLTRWDEKEGVPPGNIVNLHILLDGEPITSPSEISLSNRQRGSKFFSWLDIVTVKDYAEGQEYIKIVQRLTNDEKLDEDRQWKIISINEVGHVTEEIISYKTRSEHPLGVKLIHFTNTALVAFGYHSDILQGYPSLLFPIIYPFITGIIGLIGIIFTTIKLYSKRQD